MLKIKLQYYGHLMQEPNQWKRLWCCKRLRARGEGDDKGRDGWMPSLTQWTWVWANWEMVKERKAWCAAVYEFAKSQTWLNGWRNICHSLFFKEQVYFNFMAAVIICSDFGAQENKVCHCFHFFPIYLPWSYGTRCHNIFECWVLSQFTLFFHLLQEAL